MALRSFVEELADVAPLRPILAQLMDSIFKLMNEVSCWQGAGMQGCRDQIVPAGRGGEE